MGRHAIAEEFRLRIVPAAEVVDGNKRTITPRLRSRGSQRCRSLWNAQTVFKSPSTVGISSEMVGWIGTDHCRAG